MQNEHESRIDETPVAREQDAEETRDSHDGLQQGGTRGSSNQGGPNKGGEPEKDESVRVNSRRDRGSRSTEGHPNPIESAASDASEEAGPRGDLPPGATREDYVGGESPHKTRAEGETKGKSGVKNEVV